MVIVFGQKMIEFGAKREARSLPKAGSICSASVDLIQDSEQAISSYTAASLNVVLSKYKKTVLSTLWVHITLVVCNLPYAVVTTVKTIHSNTPPLFIVEAFAATLVFLNSSLNPVLYCWKIKEVRQAVKQTTANFRCLWKREDNFYLSLEFKQPTN